MIFVPLVLLIHSILSPYLDVASLFNGFGVGLVAFLFVIVTILIFIFVYDNLRREKKPAAAMV